MCSPPESPVIAAEITDSPKHLLEGVLVLDLADEQGSFASKLLADLGATVMKIEKPGEQPGVNRDPGYLYHNGGKSSLVLDLTSVEDMTAFRQLAKEAQVLVETLSLAEAAVLGLDYGETCRVNPGIVHLSMTPFGLVGPKADYHSCDGVLSAAGGQMHLSGLPLALPLKPFGEQSSYTASLFSAVAVVAALRERRITGRGCHIDLSMQECVAATLDHVMVDYFSNGKIAKRQGNIYGDMAFSILPCSDGFIDMTILQNWDTLLELMASENKAEELFDARWCHEAYRRENYDHLLQVVGRWTLGHSKDELFQLGQAMRFPWAPLASFAEVMKSPQLQSRSFFLTGKFPNSEKALLFPGPPYQSRSLPLQPEGPPIGSPIDDVPLRDKRAVTPFERFEPPKQSEPLPQQGDLTAKGTVTRGLLQGIRVLDFTRMLSGPYTTRILADYGAEVIKVQSGKTANGAEQNGKPYFNTWNRNKRSITLDLSSVEAREMALLLAAKCDIVVENYSPRIMADWGLTYDRLCAVRKNTIMASISAMGQEGPWRDLVGYAPTFHALSGLTWATSLEAGDPVCLGQAYGDIITGLYAALTILAALEHRDKTGRGTYIDLSAYESLCTVVGGALVDAALESKANDADFPSTGQSAGRLEGCYPCGGDDRWCFISTKDIDDWEILCRIIGRREMTGERFPVVVTSKEERAAFDLLIGQWTRERTAEEIETLLQEAGIAAAVVQNAHDLAHDRQLLTRGFFVSPDRSGQEKTLSDRTPLFFGRDDPYRWKAAPTLGEDNNYVFSELLGLSETEIQSYMKKGIIG